jgi:serine/threonine-protein kinase RsbW
MDTKYTVNFTIPFDLKHLSSVEEYVKKFFSLMNFDSKQHDMLIFKINLALTEAIVNAIKHSKEYKEGDKIKVHMELSDNNIIIHVHSKGKPFKVNNIKKPEPLSDSGRGLYVINCMMDKIDILNRNDENILIMEKTLSNE